MKFTFNHSGKLSKATVLSIWDGVAIDISRDKERVFALPVSLSVLMFGISAFFGLWMFRHGRRTAWVVPLVAMGLGCVSLVLPSGYIWNPETVRHVASSYFEMELPQIDHDELKQIMDRDQIILIDTRPEEAFLSDRIPGAINIPIGSSEINLLESLANLQSQADLQGQKGKRVVAYCQNDRCGWADRMGSIISKRTAIPVSVYAEGINGWHSRQQEP